MVNGYRCIRCGARILCEPISKESYGKCIQCGFDYYDYWNTKKSMGFAFKLTEDELACLSSMRIIGDVGRKAEAIKSEEARLRAESSADVGTLKKDTETKNICEISDEEFERLWQETHKKASEEPTEDVSSANRSQPKVSNESRVVAETYREADATAYGRRRTSVGNGNADSHLYTATDGVYTESTDRSLRYDGGMRTLRQTRLFPIWLLLTGLFLTFVPFLMAFADTNFGIELYVPFEEFFDSVGTGEALYEFEMLIFKLNSVLVTLFLCITCVRRSMRVRGFFVSLFAYIFTYNLLTVGLYFLCGFIGMAVFNTSDSGPMFYNWIVYVYLFIVIVRDNYILRRETVY